MAADEEVDVARDAVRSPRPDTGADLSRRGWDGVAARRVAAMLWPVAGLVMANLVFRAYTSDRYDTDFRALQDGALRFLDGVSVYADPYFLLTPSGLLAVVPFGLLSHDRGFLVWTTISVLATFAGIGLSVRFVGARLRSPLTAAVVLACALSESVVVTFALGNLLNSLLFALGAGFLLAECRRRPVLAGVLLGLALALKPLFVLVLLVPLLRRGWSTIGWAVAIPAAANVVGLLLVPSRQDFLTVTLPALANPRTAFNSSLYAVLTRFDTPGVVVLAARGAVVVAALLAVWRLRHVADDRVRTGSVYAVVLLAVYISSGLSETYYSATLVPALLLAAVDRDSAFRHPLAWVAAYGFFYYDGWSWPSHPRVGQVIADLRPSVSWGLLLAVLVVWAFRSESSRARNDPRPA